MQPDQTQTASPSAPAGAEPDNAGRAAADSAGSRALRRQLRIIWLAAGVACLAVSASLASFIFMERSEELEGAREQAGRTVQILAQRARTGFRIAQAAIDRASDQLSHLADREEARRALAHSIEVARSPIDPTYAFNLRLVDASGRTLDLGDGLARDPANVAGRKDVQALLAAAGNDAAWVIGEPVIYGTPPQRYIPVSRRAEANRHGIVVISAEIHVAPLVEEFDAQRPAPKGSVSLFRSDGMLLVRAPYDESEIGVQFPGPAKALSDAPFGVFEHVSPSDNIRRIVAYHEVPSASERLSISVTHATDDVLAHWYRALPYWVAIPGLAIVLMLLGAWRLDRSLRSALVAEQALYQSEERLRLAMMGATDAAWDWDLQRDALHYSPRWWTMLGYAVDELPADSALWRRIMHPEDAAHTEQVFGEALRNGPDTYEVEFRLKHRDGHYVPVLSRGYILRDAARRPVRVSGTNTDLTERHRAQEALRESEQRYRTLFANSSAAMLLIDPSDDTIVDANRAACAYYGWDLETLRRMRVTDINTLSPGEVHLEMERARGRHARHFDFRHRLASGEVRDVEVFSGPVTIGGRALLLSIVQDVTERRKAQEALKKSVAFRELLLEAMPLPVFYKDTAGRYTGCNRAFARFIGKDRSGIIGKTVYEVSPQSYAQTYRDKDLDLLDDPVGVQTYESRVLHADGTAHDVIFHKARMVDDTGAPTGLLGVITDITHIKQMEAARDQLEAQLRESQKMEALGTLAGGIAHDFNNIVTAIIGNAELARRDLDERHPALASIGEIAKASRRAKELVQQILAFGRRQVVSRDVIPLAPVVEESVRLLRATLPASVRMQVRCAPDVPPVLADATQIEQVLLNLCGNAWHAIQGAGRPGEIDIGIDVREQPRGVAEDPQPLSRSRELMPGRYVRLTVSDNGCGMDADTARRIFEPFFTTKAEGKGTGLGLAVVHGILHEHDAIIEVYSTPGEGSTFAMYFPAAQPTAMQPAGTAPELRDDTPGHAVNDAVAVDGARRHVLYVDDDDAIVFLMKRLLEQQGYRVSGFTDATAAIAAVRANPGQFDLVVSDYNMPGMSGLDVARAIRGIRADLPVAVASGYISEELRAEAPGAGVQELLYKPNTVDELSNTVARLLQARPDQIPALH